MSSSFQSIQMQFQGPVPPEMYHRYVEFKPFVAGMFTSHTIRGRLLNRALHHQHARIYNYDRTTKYGLFQEPSQDLTKLFLDFVHYDEGGRIFTYVLSLDGLFRFTETGKEFGIDLLSKHTMHSDVSIYIAFSGEFFVRRVKHAKLHKNDSVVDPEDEIHLPSTPRDEDREKADEASKANATDSSKAEGKKQVNGMSNGTPDLKKEKSPRTSFLGKKETNGTSNLDKEKTNGTTSTPKDNDPTHYELIIDNDSGTYRPNADTLPLLHSFLAHSLPGLKIRTLDCQKDEELQKKLKNEQREKKKAAAGDKKVTYMQNSSMSSLSSSDEEELERRGREGEDFHENKYKHGMHKFIGGGRDDFHGEEDGVQAPENHADQAQQPIAQAA
jgi:hypothetical protein